MKKWIVLVGFVVTSGIIYSLNSDKIKGRTISSETASLSEYTKEDTAVANINKHIIEISNKDQINDKIDEIQKISQANPNWQIVKLYATLTRPIKKLEGILWRLRPIINNCGVCHLSVISMIRKAYYSKYMTGPHIHAFLDYFTKPTGNFEKLEAISDLQNFIVKEVLPELEGDSGVLSKVNKIIEDTKPGFFMEVDTYLSTGYSSQDGYDKDNVTKNDQIRFISEKRHFAIVTQGNLYNIVAAAEGALTGIHYLQNYNFDKAEHIANKLVKKTALNNLFGKTPKDLTPIEVLKVLEREEYKSFGRARTDNGYTPEKIQANLDIAFKYYKQSIASRLKALERSYEEVNQKSDADYLISSKVLALNYDGNVAKLKEKMRMLKKASHSSLTKQIVVVTSPRTGKQFQVNLKPIFKYHEDLKVFLPHQKFVESDRKSSVYVKNKKGKETKETIWNYDYGLPLAWKKPTFAGLLPQATNETLLEIVRSIKLTPATEALANILPVP